MDPTANFSEQLAIAARILRAQDDNSYPDENDSFRLAELVEALNGWIRKGGFLPEQWKR